MLISRDAGTNTVRQREGSVTRLGNFWVFGQLLRCPWCHNFGQTVNFKIAGAIHWLPKGYLITKLPTLGHFKNWLSFLVTLEGRVTRLGDFWAFGYFGLDGMAQIVNVFGNLYTIFARIGQHFWLKPLAPQPLPRLCQLFQRYRKLNIGQAAFWPFLRLLFLAS